VQQAATKMRPFRDITYQQRLKELKAPDVLLHERLTPYRQSQELK
jgi:hypothetical protein